MDEYRKRIKRENIWLRIGVVLMLALDVVGGFSGRRSSRTPAP